MKKLSKWFSEFLVEKYGGKTYSTSYYPMLTFHLGPEELEKWALAVEDVDSDEDKKMSSDSDSSSSDSSDGESEDEDMSKGRNKAQRSESIGAQSEDGGRKEEKGSNDDGEGDNA